MPLPTKEFYYKDIDLFERVKALTSSRARVIVDEKQAYNSNLGMTEDDKTLFNIFLETAMYDVFEIFQDLNKGLTTAIYVSSTSSGHGADAYSGFFIADNGNYNAHILLFITNKVKECLVNYILAQWYKNCGMGDDFKIHYDYYLIEKENLTEGIYKVRKPAIT